MTEIYPSTEPIRGGEPTPDQSELRDALNQSLVPEVSAPEPELEAIPIITIEIQNQAEQIIKDFESGGVPLVIIKRSRDILKAYGFTDEQIENEDPVEILQILKDKVGKEEALVQGESLIEETLEKRKIEEAKVKLGPAVWRNKQTGDNPVVITGIAGWGTDGKLYVNIEGSISGLLFDEIIYKSQEEKKSIEPENPPVSPEPGSIPPADSETLFILEQDLEKSRQDYFGAKASKRAIFSRKKILPDDQLRQLGEKYEQAKNEIIRRQVKIDIAVLKEIADFQGKNEQERQQAIIDLVNNAQQQELQKVNELILGKDKGNWQKFKEKYNKLNPKLRIAVGAALTAGSVITAYTGLGGVSTGLVSARTALSGAGAGMTTEAIMASKQEKGKVGAIAKEARKTKTGEQEITNYLKEQVNQLSPQEVVTELARIRNIGESKGVTEAKQAISYGRMSEMFGVLAKKMKLKKDVKQSTQELTGKTIELLEQKYHENIKTEARAVTQDRELTPEQAAEAYLNKVFEKQQEFNKAQEIQLDKQRKNALKRVIWSISAGTVTAGVTAITGIIRIDKIQAAQEAEKLSQAATTAEVKAPAVSLENINPDLYTVKAGEGIETKGIQQILDNPEKFGFTGDLGNKAEVQSFANKLAHEAAFNTKIGDSTVVGATKAGEIYDLRLKASAIGKQIELTKGGDGKWHYEFGKGIGQNDIYEHVEKTSAGSSIESSVPAEVGTNWHQAEFPQWSDKVVAWREALPSELSADADLSDISMRAVDINGDGQVDTYFLYDIDDKQVLDQVSLEPGKSSTQLLEQAQAMYQQIGQEAKVLDQIVGEVGKSWDTGDKIIFSRGLGAEFNNGAFNESSLAIIRQAVDKLGQQAPEFMRDHNLGEYIKGHLEQITCEQIEKMHDQGIVLYKTGWQEVDYNYVAKMVKYNRVTDGLELKTKLLSPATNKNLAVEFISKSKFDDVAVNQTYEVAQKAQTELADYVRLLKNRFEIIPAARDHSLVERVLSLDAKASLADFKGSYGGEQQVMIDKLYQELNQTLAGKLSQGTLSGSIGENLDGLAVSKASGQALIERAELLEKQFQAEDLIKEAKAQLGQK